MNKTVFISLFLLALPTHAMMPVVDAGAIVQLVNQLKQLKDQYDLLSKTYTNAKDQLSNAKSQLAAVDKIKNFNSGHYGFGDLSNGVSDLKHRQWSPNSWDEALHNISGGNPERYQQLVKAYRENHRTLNDETYRKGATPERLVLYQQNKAVNEAVSVQTTYAFNDVNEHLKIVHALSSRIEKAENTKSTIDLNSRLLAEIAYIQAQSLKLQALISQQSAQVSATDISSDSETARFNILPDE